MVFLVTMKIMADILLNVRPAAVRGPVNSGVARVVADEEVVSVVTAQGTSHYQVLEEPVVTAPGKWKIQTSDGELTVVKSGGCTCGKPWMTKTSNTELLYSARQTLGVGAEA